MDRTIYVVDDNSQFTEKLVMALICRGARSLSLGTGATALSRYRRLVEHEGLPAMLVVSIDLPDLQGAEFLASVAREGLLCTLVLTSEDFSADELRALIRTPRVAVIAKNRSVELVAERIIQYCPALAASVTKRRPLSPTELLEAVCPDDEETLAEASV